MNCLLIQEWAFRSPEDLSYIVLHRIFEGLWISYDELPQISEYEQAEGHALRISIEVMAGLIQEGDKNDITKEIASEISDDQTDKGVRSILEEDLHDINGLPDD